MRDVNNEKIWGTVTMVGITPLGAEVCAVVINFNGNFPENIGSKYYLNQIYWKKMIKEADKK